MKNPFAFAILILTAACAQPQASNTDSTPCPCCEKMKESGMEDCCCKDKAGGKKMCMHGTDKAKPKQSMPAGAH